MCSLFNQRGLEGRSTAHESSRLFREDQRPNLQEGGNRAYCLVLVFFGQYGRLVMVLKILFSGSVAQWSELGI